MAANCLSFSSVMRLSGCAGLRAVRSREHPRLAFVTVILSGINPPSCSKRRLVCTACRLYYPMAVYRLSDYHLDAIEHGLFAVLGAIMRNIFVMWRIVLSRVFMRSNAPNEPACLLAHAPWRMRIEMRGWIDLLSQLTSRGKSRSIKLRIVPHAANKIDRRARRRSIESSVMNGEIFLSAIKWANTKRESFRTNLKHSVLERSIVPITMGFPDRATRTCICREEQRCANTLNVSSK